MVIDYLFFQAFLPYAASNYFVHFLGDGESLVDEAVRQLLHLTLLHCEHEIVSPVVPQRERAVVLAEDGAVAHTLGLLRDVDVAVAHRLHLAGGHKGCHLHILRGREIQELFSVIGFAEGHHAVQRLLSVFFLVHLFLSFARRRSDCLRIYSRRSSSPQLRLFFADKDRAKKKHRR